MQIGFNFTLNATLDMVQRMIKTRQIDYCELLIDNFLHVPPKELETTLDCPIAFHIMFSKFLESDDEVLGKLAKRIRILIDALNPIYVSDHLLRFTHEGRCFYNLGEIDYETQFDAVRQRVEKWQDLLGRRLYLENFPSIMEGGWDAPAFYRRLSKETGAGVLFDASNAVCAKHNCGAPLDLWNDIIETTQHFHVAGYAQSFSAPHVIVDAHDREMAPDTIEFLSSMRSSFDKPGATITYERDINIDYDSIAVDLQRLREIFPRTQELEHADLVACAS
ncbi:hypothetical protein MSC49_04140 [Methylosinus sp. C49]|uniref:methanobactin biosynthesis protein MbnB n=1 Tax=Methylosinus sp. C49 TaxID=2699395 RepID=UPI001366DFF2|nr:hypothetical protein MSC49_04140 [Methylosinus sp. C49]